MEKEDDGSARAARIEKNKPTRAEDQEFRILMIAMVFVLTCVFGMGVIGSVIIFWRIWG
jgi:Tfp pilus assembly protein PilN